MSELEGYWGPTVGLALGLRKGQAQRIITVKRGLHIYIYIYIYKLIIEVINNIYIYIYIIIIFNNVYNI